MRFFKVRVRVRTREFEPGFSNHFRLQDILQTLCQRINVFNRPFSLFARQTLQHPDAVTVQTFPTSRVTGRARRCTQPAQHSSQCTRTSILTAQRALSFSPDQTLISSGAGKSIFTQRGLTRLRDKTHIRVSSSLYESLPLTEELQIC